MLTILKDIHDTIKEHTLSSGLLSAGSIGLGKIILGFVSIIPITVGTIVGLITIYTWLEKKGLLPKWLQLPDKNNK